VGDVYHEALFLASENPITLKTRDENDVRNHTRFCRCVVDFSRASRDG